MTSNRTDGSETGEFRLTGRHVLSILLAVFLVVGGVNVFMVWKAIGSFPGTVTESSYRDSQRFNREIAEAEKQAARGWTVDAHADRSEAGRVTIRIDARDAKGAPVNGVVFRAMLQHPAQRSLDHVVALQPVVGASGRWEGVADGVSEGKWGLEVEGEGAQGRVFLSQNSLYLK